MKKFLPIFLLLFLFSCQEEEKKNTNSSSQQKSIIDTNSSIEVVLPKENVAPSDSISKEDNSGKNILSKENEKAPNRVKSISELWKQYKDAKASATNFISKNNLDSIIVYLNIAADAAYELSREDIATWQLNNIGYYSISEFKSRTDYDSRMQQLATMKDFKKKRLFAEETKNVFRESFNILTYAQDYLYKAQLLDSELEPSERTETIDKNLQFIEWIGNYISNGSITTKSRSIK